MKPRLLDLCCAAGGAARGYQLAGFHVTGVDVNPQPNYCGDEFHQADAVTFPLDGYDVIHASPPCPRYSTITPHENRDSHPDLYEPIRDRLVASGVPWVIENVIGSPYRSGVVLCGSMFGLRVRRHRNFESSHLLTAPCGCRHREQGTALGVYGDGGGGKSTRPSGGGGHEGAPPRVRRAHGDAVGHTLGDRLGDPAGVHRTPRPPVDRRARGGGMIVEFHPPAALMSMNDRAVVPYRNGPRSKRGAPRETLLRFLASSTDECLLWPHAIGPTGYGRIAWGGVTHPAHMVMCGLAHGTRPAPALEAAHSCGVRACVNPRHLRWATRRENSLDRNLHGTMLTGERGTSARLTAAQVIEIRRAYAAGEATQTDLATTYGVHQTNITAIVHRRSWKELP